MESDTERIRVEAARQDYQARKRASSSRSKQYINLSRMLDECQILLFL
jgi:hypothetical protein